MFRCVRQLVYLVRRVRSTHCRDKLPVRSQDRSEQMRVQHQRKDICAVDVALEWQAVVAFDDVTVASGEEEVLDKADSSL